MTGCCECGDETSGFCATELVISLYSRVQNIDLFAFPHSGPVKILTVRFVSLYKQSTVEILLFPEAGVSRSSEI
jgi:hypothetical protein